MKNKVITKIIVTIVFKILIASTEDEFTKVSLIAKVSYPCLFSVCRVFSILFISFI